MWWRDEGAIAVVDIWLGRSLCCGEMKGRSLLLILVRGDRFLGGKMKGRSLVVVGWGRSLFDEEMKGRSLFIDI